MKKEDIRVCILRVGGTNCDVETQRAFKDLGIKSEVIHSNEFIKKKRLFEYEIIVFPGGFSYGDYIRAGAIWSKEIVSKLGYDLKSFVEAGKFILGICNGFQVLVESGLLPGFEGISDHPEASLAPNTSMSYECRWIYLKHENSGNCPFTKNITRGEKVFMPVAHAEGRFLFLKDIEGYNLRRLYDNDQLVFRYCDQNGKYADGKYPTNPNGSFHDIAGVCNPEGNVFGLMPHPERAYYGWQLPDWTGKTKMPKYSDGRLVFKSIIEHIVNNF